MVDSDEGKGFGGRVARCRKYDKPSKETSWLLEECGFD